MKRTAFNVIRQIQTVDITNLVNTNHNINERTSRTNNIINIIGGFGKPVRSFIVDTQHPNGNEIHTITDNGIIVIQNQNTKKLITSLIARPNQIKRYFTTIPTEIYKIINIAEEHHKKGYNLW